MAEALQAALNQMGDLVRPGQSLHDALTASRINAIMTAIRSLARGDNIKSGNGVLLRQMGSSGVTLSALNTRGGRGAGKNTSLAPFDLKLTTVDSTTMGVDVNLGTLNGLTATNALTAYFTKSNSDLKYFYLVANASNGEVTSFSYEFDAVPATPVGATPTSPASPFRILIGILNGQTWYRVAGPGSLVARPLVVFSTPIFAPAAGEAPYVPYYTWNVTNAV